MPSLHSHVLLGHFNALTPGSLNLERLNRIVTSPQHWDDS